MDSNNRFFTLPLQFDVQQLIEDLAVAEAQQWTSHYNQKDYDGNWTGIALRSATGGQENILASPDAVYSDTPLLLKCPYFHKIVSAFECPVESVRLLSLAPGSEIKTHRDQGLSYEQGCFRLHIPILTDDGVAFVVDDEQLDMQPGSLWYANFDLPHSVKHAGTTRRVHLIIDGLRNAWTDILFGKAGYDFSEENQTPVYDMETRRQMLEHLRLMDNDAARAIIAQLEATPASAGKADIPKAPLFHEWIPTHITGTSNPPVCQWMYLDGTPFTDPFFGETLQKVHKLAVNRQRLKVFSGLDFLTTATSGGDCLAPDAFIFHISRCGSTLLAQMLATQQDTVIAVSEPPILDDILRLPFQQPSFSTEDRDRAFKGAVAALGRKRKGTERHFVIKLDSWHLFSYNTIRQLYPQTPLILLYRKPEEVFLSQQKSRGIQSIPGALEPAMTGVPASPVDDWRPYFATLLGKYLEQMHHIATTDGNTFLLNYQQGINGMIATLEAAMKIHFPEDVVLQMQERSQFHSKSPKMRFEETPETFPDPELLREAEKWYGEIALLSN